MRRAMKSAACLIALFAAATALPAQQALFPADPAGFVTDAAGVLEQHRIDRLTRTIEYVREKSRGEIAVVTLADIGRSDAGRVAMQIGRAWGVGARAPEGDPARNTGVVVLLVPRETALDGVGRIAISIGQGTERFTSDDMASNIRMAASPLLSRGDYGAGLEVIVELLADRYANEFGFPSRSTILAQRPALVRRLGPKEPFESADRYMDRLFEAQQEYAALISGTSSSSASARTPAPAPAAPRIASDLVEGIPSAGQRNADAIAVIIGNQKYQNAPAVEYAMNDAAAMRQYAERVLGINPGNILVLENATLTNMQLVFGREGDASGKLSDLVTRGTSEVFVFFSGHGAPDPREERAYLMPVDADADRLKLSGFSLDVLYENLAALGAKHVTVVLDACFSGASGGGGMLIAGASPIGIRVTDPAARFAGGGATILTAASGQEFSNWYPEQGHGLFTYFFLKGLEGSADANEDGAVTLGEMREWLTNPTRGVPYQSRRIYGMNREQTPQVWGDSARRIR